MLLGVGQANALPQDPPKTSHDSCRAFAQPFQVGDQVPSGVGTQVGVRGNGVRQAASAAALVNSRTRSRAGSKNCRISAVIPPPGPPCTNTAGFPDGLPHSSQ